MKEYVLTVKGATSEVRGLLSDLGKKNTELNVVSVQKAGKGPVTTCVITIRSGKNLNLPGILGRINQHFSELDFREKQEE